jgi:hypothetical protein
VYVTAAKDVAVGGGDDFGPQALHGVDVAVVGQGVEPLVPGGDEAVEQLEALAVQVLRYFVDLVDRAGREGGERVNRPQHAGPLVVERPGRRTVEDRGDDQAQAPVAGDERLGRLPPDHPVHGHRGPLQGEPLPREEAGHQRCLRAHVQHVVEAPRVVAIVVGEEDPADILGLDEREDLLSPVLPMNRGTGIDDDRLLAPDQERVHLDVGARLRRGEVRDEEGLR